MEIEMPKEFTDLKGEISIAELSRQLTDQKDEITHLHLWYGIKAVNKTLEDIKADYVKKSQFVPVRNIVYGMVSLILVTVLGAMLNSVIIKANANIPEITQTH